MRGREPSSVAQGWRAVSVESQGRGLIMGRYGYYSNADVRRDAVWPRGFAPEDEMPPEIRQTFVENAPTFLDETRDPEALAFDPAVLNGFAGPLLLTVGDQSPPMFAPVVAKIAAAAPRIQVRTLNGMGHVPQLTAPDAYADMIVEFVRAHAS